MIDRTFVLYLPHLFHSQTLQEGNYTMRTLSNFMFPVLIAVALTLAFSAPLKLALIYTVETFIVQPMESN